MKVLQVNCVYKKGSTGKITYDIHKGLQEKGIESIVCYGRGEKVNEKNVYKTCGEFYSKINHFIANLTGIMYGHCYFSTKKLINIIKKEKPDIVHLQCINGYFVNIYKLITWLKNNNIKTVLTLHAEFMYTANCGHAFECERWKEGCKNCKNPKLATSSYFVNRTNKSWKKMKKAFDGFNKNLIVVSVSPWLMDRAKKSPILNDKNHKVVLNGLDTNIFHYYETKELRKKYAKENEKIILHVTPGFSIEKEHIKGGYYVVKVAEELKNENIKILVAGNYKEGIKVPKNVILLGRVNSQEELAKLYSMADITLLTSKKETFSMVTAESLCCGTPVIGFKAGGPEQIAIKEYSKFIEYGNLKDLKIEILKTINNKLEKNKISNESYNKYSSQKMSKEYIKIYKELKTGEKNDIL